MTQAQRIARLALAEQNRRPPADTIHRELGYLGITGNFGSQVYRKAFLACERAWRGAIRSGDVRKLCGREGCDTPVHRYQRKYCGRECWRHAATGGYRKWLVCPACGESFDVRPSEAPRRTTCSPDCSAAHQAGMSLGDWTRTKQEIVDRKNRGESMVDIARDLGMRRQRVYQIWRSAA